MDKLLQAIIHPVSFNFSMRQDFASWITHLADAQYFSLITIHNCSALSYGMVAGSVKLENTLIEN
jgi:hypothetical protein